MLHFIDDGGDFGDVEEIGGDEVGEKRCTGDDTKLRECLEERIVGGHEREEFRHAISDATTNEGSDEHARECKPKSRI